MEKMIKGEYGYIQKKKKKNIIKLMLLFVVAIIIFVIGLLLNKNSVANMFTVIAILFVLPWARVFVEFVVMFPYKTPSHEHYQLIKETVEEPLQLYSDMVITSPEKAMNLDFLIIANGSVFGVLGKEKQDLDYIQTYLSKGIHNWSTHYKVKIFKDYKSFLKSLTSLTEAEVSEKEVDDVNAYVRSLIV